MRDIDQSNYYNVIFKIVSLGDFPLLQVTHLCFFSATDGNIHNLSSDISFPYGSHEPKM